MKNEILEVLNKNITTDYCSGCKVDFIKKCDFEKVTKDMDALFAKRIVSKLLNEKEEIDFDSWRLQHNFKITEHGYIKNGINYMVNDITFMYISDVFNI